MTTVKSDKILIAAPARIVYEKLTNLENLRPLLEKVSRDDIPEDKREMFDNLKITADSITIPAGPVGEITLKMADCMPYSLIQLVGESAPVPMLMSLEIEESGEEECRVQVGISLDIPIMLKPMVAGPLRKIVDQFAKVLGAIKFES